MNSSQFMDKQIMDLSAGGSSPPHSKEQVVDFINAQNEHLHIDDDGDIGNGIDKKDEILPNYDFQPIRSVGLSQSSNLDVVADGGGSSRILNSSNSIINTSAGIKGYDSIDSIEPTKVVNKEKDRNILDAAMISEIDRTMKRHADNLLHALEGISARITQLDSRTRSLENSVDDLQASVGNNLGTADGKMRQLENIIREVRANVLVIRDNQEKMEAQVQLTNFQLPKVDQYPPTTQNTPHIDIPQQPVSAAPQPSPLQHDQPHDQNQYPYFQQPSQSQEAIIQQYLLPPAPQLQQTPPPAPPPSQYQPAQYSQPPIKPPPPQQFYGPPSHGYDFPSGKSNPGFSSGYGPQPGPNDPYSYNGPTQYGGGSPGGGGRGYPQLPTARVLPQALPTAASVATARGGGGSSGSGNRVPIDDVVDKVTGMGFSRDLVRATVQKLTENGQAVDLNIVLDKMMNGGDDAQPPAKGWFGR